MGFYIETPLPTMRAMHLEIHHQGVKVNKPREFKDIPKGKVLVCVVDNLAFEAAGIVYDEREFKAFTDHDDHRRKTWLLLPKKEVVKLCPRVEKVLKEDS